MAFGKYTSEDLDAFRLLHDKEHLDGTAYFELHPGELPEPYACWLDGSLFVRDAGFDFFVGCFHAANSKWDYFESEPFDTAQSRVLAQEIGAFAATLTTGSGRDAIFARYGSPFGRDMWAEVDTDMLRGAVQEAASGLEDWIRNVQRSGEVLWVLGM